MLRAWNVKAEEGLERDVREAVVRVRHIGGAAGSSMSPAGGRWDCWWWWCGEVGDVAGESLSFVEAIWVRREARRRRSSVAL